MNIYNSDRFFPSLMARHELQTENSTAWAYKFVKCIALVNSFINCAHSTNAILNRFHILLFFFTPSLSLSLSFSNSLSLSYWCCCCCCFFRWYCCCFHLKRRKLLVIACRIVYNVWMLLPSNLMPNVYGDMLSHGFLPSGELNMHPYWICACSVNSFNYNL